MKHNRSNYFLLLIFVSFLSCSQNEQFIETLRVTPVYNASGTLNEVYFINELTGVVSGDNGCFFTTFDGGLTWNKIAVDDTLVSFNRISFPTPLVGYISGDPNVIMKTTDGGHTWFPARESEFLDYTYFPSEDVGFGINNYTSKVYRTTNGGENWTETNFSSATGLLSPDALFFFSEDTGIVIDNYFNEVSFTYNGGSSWHLSYEDDWLGATFRHRTYKNISYWAYGYAGAINGIFYTDDYGDHVNRFETEGLLPANYSYLNSINTHNGVLYCTCGQGIFAVSNNGGAYWTEYYDQNGENFEMYDAAALTESIFIGINESTIYRLTAF